MKPLMLQTHLDFEATLTFLHIPHRVLTNFLETEQENKERVPHDLDRGEVVSLEKLQVAPGLFSCLSTME